MNKSELVDIIRADKAEFKRIRNQDPDAEMDLSGVDLSRCDLSGAPMAGANLKGACLRGSDCTKANLRSADLSGADLRDVKLDGANLHHTKLLGADMDGATLGGVDSRARMCLHVDSFRGTRWSREALETMLRILNENGSWEIRYELIPKRSEGGR